MASSTGSSPRFPRSCGPEARGRRRLAALLVAAGLAANTVLAALPGYVREALSKFNPEVPPGWAYTITTTRGDVTASERFDPAKPPAERWTLLRHKGAAPGAKDLEKYAQLKAVNPGPTTQAAFTKADIEPGSLELIREDDERAEFKGLFRSESTGADKMLGHLQLELVVNKRLPHIERYRLGLIEPYNPVLGVKMKSLAVEMTFTAPTADRPSLPAVSTSHFTGRIFFIGTEEHLRVEYADFARTE